MKHEDSYYFDVVRYNIKLERNKKGLTQQELADKAMISMNYLAKIESSKMAKGFSLVVIGRIADALEIDIRELFKPIENQLES